MKIVSLQFCPSYGDVTGSIARVENLLQDLHPEDVDFLLLPELALAGYNFPSLEAIEPFLEFSQSGTSSIWARTTAQRLSCIVSIGYAETTNRPSFMVSTDDDKNHNPRNLDRKNNFNANITYGPDGSLVAHYRKHFLYMIDETWCVEGSERFFAGEYPAPVNQRVAMGICMDINPYRFMTPLNQKEFANHALNSGASLVVVCMAWTNLDLLPDETLKDIKKMLPDEKTLAYWFNRFSPLIEAEKSVLLVMGNRCGVERDIVYAGTSLIARVGRGMVEVWDIAGRGEERLLVVDTHTRPKFIWDFEISELIPNPPS